MTHSLKSLLWKEWREHQWKLASMTAITVLVPVAMWGSDRPGDFLQPLLGTLLFYLPLSAVFIATGAAASERSGGTLAWVRAMPRSPRLLATLKLFFSIATVTIPAWIAIGLTVVAMQVANQLDLRGVRDALDGMQSIPLMFDTGYLAIDLALLSAVVTVSVVVWVAALGVNHESEVRAGAIGLVAIVALWACYGGAMFWLKDPLAERLGGELVGGYFIGIGAALPGGAFIVNQFPGAASYRWLIASSYLIAHGGLALWYIARFGRTESAAVWSPRLAPSFLQTGDWLGPPHRTPLRALAWKQARESGPLLIAGLAGSLGLLGAIVATVVVVEGSEAVNAGLLALSVTAIFTGFSYVVGIVAGIGLTTAELEPRLYTFWRSRPIDIDRWFWTKCGMGFLLMLVVFGCRSLLDSRRSSDWGCKTCRPWCFGRGLCRWSPGCSPVACCGGRSTRRSSPSAPRRRRSAISTGTRRR